MRLKSPTVPTCEKLRDGYGPFFENWIFRVHSSMGFRPNFTALTRTLLLVSYQSHSSRSWELRLEISRQLFNTGVSKALGYDDVLKYTHELTQAMNSLSSGDVDEVKGEDSAHRPVLAYTYLYFQLKECLFALINYISREVKACFGFQKTYVIGCRETHSF